MIRHNKQWYKGVRVTVRTSALLALKWCLLVLVMRLLLMFGILALIGCSYLPQTALYTGGEENSRYRLTYTVMPEQNCNTTYLITKLVGSRILHPSAKVCLYLWPFKRHYWNEYDQACYHPKAPIQHHLWSLWASYASKGSKPNSCRMRLYNSPGMRQRTRCHTHG